MAAVINSRKVDSITEDNSVAAKGSEVDEDTKPKREIKMRTITLDPDNVHTFYGRKNYLSSFSEAPMLIAGHLYPTVEHYYEACKVYALCGPFQAMYLKGAQDPGQVKSLSKRILAAQRKTKKDAERWKRRDGLLVIRVGLMEKFRQNPRLRNNLFKTGDALLVQCNQYDTLWSTGMDGRSFDEWLSEHSGETLDVPVMVQSYTVKHIPEIGKGKNLLGFILMYVRECLRAEYGVASASADKLAIKDEEDPKKKEAEKKEGKKSKK
jgi:ribA/ribD-fused uncharacterized protein